MWSGWPVGDGVEVVNFADGWCLAFGSSGATRDGAWVAESTYLVDLSKCRPEPG